MSHCAYPWVPDKGDGTYNNPVICADYSDPDVIRHGDDFWMVSSSFNCTPGIPVLHSKDLVNWRIVNHAVTQLPDPSYSEVRVGAGIFAPAIREHGGKFYVVFPMPDEGVYVTASDDPAGQWSEPHLLARAKGWIDPCPFWDDDGQAYLAHAYAFSRSGLKERIHLRPMSADARRLLGEGRELFHTPHHLYLEGPKLHKLDGWYYVMCPGGGVQAGWQVAFRSRSIWGPYEERIVLEQGDTEVNGPHQGAFVDAPDESWWFVHFQDKGVFGRVTHLQPVRWEDGWPVVGEVRHGKGQPVARHQKPVAGQATAIPATSDDFATDKLGLQWQWQANHGEDWYSLTERPGFLRLTAGPGDAGNLFRYPRFLGQKFPAERFAVKTSVDVVHSAPGSIAGLAIIGGDQSHFTGLRRTAGGADYVLGTPEGMKTLGPCPAMMADLAGRVEPGGTFRFIAPESPAFAAASGGWIGAKVGLFHLTHDLAACGAPADFATCVFST
jgi:beta-xylosidase